jgi:hypothetical protein
MFAHALSLIMALTFYLLAWLTMQLVVNVLLPLLDPEWAEHGGEIWRAPDVATKPEEAWRGRLGSVPRDDSSLWSIVLPAALALALLDLMSDTSGLTAVAITACIGGALVAAAGLHALRRPAASTVEALALGLVMALLTRADAWWLYGLSGALPVVVGSLPTVRGQPAINSLAAAMLLYTLVVPGAHVAADGWTVSPLLPLLTVNAALLVSVRRSRLPLSASFLGFLILHAAVSGDTATGLLLPSAILLFATFVLPDPTTTPDRPIYQILTGLVVGIAGLWLEGHGVPLPYVVAVAVSTAARGLWGAARWVGSDPEPGWLAARLSLFRTKL